MSRPKLLGVDFDGTVVSHMFPHIGTEVPDAVRVLKRVLEAGHEIVLWTCREDEPEHDNKRNYLTQAVQWMYESGLKLRSVNENTEHDDFRLPTGQRRKVYADFYVDDRAVGCPLRPNGTVDWIAVEKILEKAGWFDA